MRRALGMALIPAVVAGLALADVPLSSPRPQPSPVQAALPADPLVLQFRPRPRPAGLEVTLANPVKLQTDLLPVALPKPPPATLKGAVCNNPQIKGLTLKPITSRVEGCGVNAPVQVSSIAGVALSPAAVINCDEAQALATWVVKGMQPAFKNTIVKMTVADSYSCRPRNNVHGAKVSEHGSGNAIDISGFVTNTGKTYTVAANYNSMVRAAQKAACGIFHTTLGPGSDGYHETHLHFDVAPYRGRPYCR